MKERKRYALKLTDDEWIEVEALSFEPFEVSPGDQLTRLQWIAIGEMCLGKAVRIERGDYDPMNDEDPYSAAKWAHDLRGIAKKIFNKFRPGDGKM